MLTGTGPSLPQSLLEEINGQQENLSHRHKPNGNRQLSRKEARKQERENCKQRKAEFFTRNRTQPTRMQTKRTPEQEHPDSPKPKKAKLGKSAPTVSNHFANKQSLPNGQTPLEKLIYHSKTIPKKTKPRPVSATATLRSKQEEEEDAYIAYLESKLGYRKGGKRTGKGGEDGLDDLLSDLDSIKASVFAGASTRTDDVDEGMDIGDPSDAESSDDVETGPISDGKETPKVEDEEWGGIQEESPKAAEEKASENVDSPLTTTQNCNAGAGANTLAGRYVPPHLRNQPQNVDATVSEAHLRLTRQLKGLLNRMSEQNIASIVDGVEEIYRNNRRHDVTSTLTTFIVDGISSHSMLLDSYVVLHAAFVSALHKLIGIEFAAYFVQSSVVSYERQFNELQTNPATTAAASVPAEGQPEGAEEMLGKECSNLIILLSELYNFQVISCLLVYDIIRGLLDGELTELKIELLLKITRNSGQQLRQDDPTALKSIIQIVQTKLPSQANAMSSRARFMVETLTNLKNNKVKKNAGAVAGGETIERLKKFLFGLSKRRHVLSHEPLRVSLEDLHNAESKGKWWLVGAAWGGDPLVEHRKVQREPSTKDSADAEAISENNLLKLARKQGMNTEIRRGIFVVLMSSEDYVDACERLSQLKLTEVQQREIIRVILHCCGNEKTYNPYYTLVGQHLCRTSHSHKITLQFCLWDFLRGLGETNVGGAEVIKNLGEDVGFNVKSISSTRLRNVARAYGWWIAKDCCNLAILKPVDFTLLKPQSYAFLKELLTQVLVSTQVSTPLLTSDLPATRNRAPLEEVFIKATRVQNLAVGLLYFLGEALREAMDENGFIVWADQVARDTLRTGMDVVAGL